MNYTKHVDNRRIIYDWASAPFKSCKIVEVLEEIAIGDHYHNNKTEEFFLQRGEFRELTIGDETVYNVSAPHKVTVPPGVYHRFVCSVGSVIIGVATELFDPTDEIKRADVET